jgi:hypothetical protein
MVSARALEPPTSAGHIHVAVAGDAFMAARVAAARRLARFGAKPDYRLDQHRGGLQ